MTTIPHLSALIRTYSAPVDPHLSAFRTAPIYGVRGAVRCVFAGFFKTSTAPEIRT